jgi:RHS repeat-associated protein
VAAEIYLYGSGVDNVLSREANGQVTWSLGDRQGSIVDLVNEQGEVVNHFVYDSFGNRTEATSADFRFGYTGRELDTETGLYYYRARYYDSAVGRFISEDPIGFSAGDTNLYRYVNNSPTNWTDALGTDIFSDTGNFLYDRLVDTDKVVAGFANFWTGSYSTQLRNEWYGDKVADQHEGLLFNVGQGLGFVAGVGLGLVTPNALVGSISWAGRAAQGYTVASTGIGAYNTTTKIRNGEIDWNNPWSYLEVASSYAPAIGFGAKVGFKVGSDKLLKPSTLTGFDDWLSAGIKGGLRRDIGAVRANYFKNNSTVFYSVQNLENEARLASGGIPWPTAPQHAHLGEGLYTWPDISAARAYQQTKVSNLQNNGVTAELNILSFRVSNSNLNKFKKIDLRNLSEDAQNAWLSKASTLFSPDASASHNYQYVIRETFAAKTFPSTEHYFRKDIFGKFKSKRVG